ncbi:hypothetical protein [Bradyrhizobium sp.]|uniref:hypothetical protein n=1 Tax=Bradyrhizobium sp. TaxID=376 RepID=UPI003BAF473F
MIFSDKSCGYTDSGDPLVDWSRWYSESIAKSAHQIEQAERWVRNYPDNVFLDAKCTEVLPIALPASDMMRVHRICVAIGALDRAEIETGRRALKVKPTVKNDEELFTVGKIDEARGWVHVFDENTLATLMSPS